MKVLIITKSFVREVSYFVQQASRGWPACEFALIMPSCEGRLAVPVFLPKVYFSGRIRASFYGGSFAAAFKTFQPDVIQIFEEYSGFIAFQSTLLRDLWCRQSKLMVYSAENLAGNVRALFYGPRKYVMARADLAFVCSQSVKPVLAAEGYSKPIWVFPLGVDTSKFYKFAVERLKTALNLDKKFVLGYVGRLLEFKGIFLLIEMMRYLPEHVHLLMIGSGPEEQNLKAAAAKYQLAHRIHLLGKVSYEQLPQYLNCMDLGIIPSKTISYWKEQFGRVLIELMSCEVPVLGSDSGAIPELIGEAGYIFQENDLPALLARVRMLLDAPALRRKLAQCGRERVITHYSLKVMCENFFSMYQSLRNEH